MLTASMTGKKLPMFAMGKIKKPCCFKNVKEFILFMQRKQEK